MPTLRRVPTRPKLPRTRLGTRFLRPASGPPPPRQPPVLVDYAETTWVGNGAKSTGTSVSWQTGDRLVVLGIASSQTGSLPVPTTTGSGVTFTADTPVTTASTDWANTWTATAAANGSAAIDSTGETGSGAWGMAVWVYRGSDGFGNRAANGDTAKTISLSRSQADSAVIFGLGDTSGGATTGYAWTPTVDNEREVQANANHSVYVGDWTDQVTAGTTSYGITGGTATGNLAKIALEILGATAAAAGLDPAPTAHPITQLAGYF